MNVTDLDDQTMRGPAPPARRRNILWSLVAGLEVAAAVVVVLADLFIPSVVLVGLAAVSLVLRRRGPGSLGFHRPAHPWRLTSQMARLGATFLGRVQLRLDEATEDAVLQQTPPNVDLWVDGKKVAVFALSPTFAMPCCSSPEDLSGIHLKAITQNI